MREAERTEILTLLGIGKEPEGADLAQIVSRVLSGDVEGMSDDLRTTALAIACLRSADPTRLVSHIEGSGVTAFAVQMRICGPTRKDMAHLIGVSTQSIGNYVNGRTPTSDRAFRELSSLWIAMEAGDLSSYEGRSPQVDLAVPKARAKALDATMGRSGAASPREVAHLVEGVAPKADRGSDEPIPTPRPQAWALIRRFQDSMARIATAVDRAGRGS